MAKQLSIIVKAVDEATAPLRAVQGQIAQTSSAGQRASSTLGSALGRLGVVLGPVTAAVTALLGTLSVAQTVRGLHQTAMAMDEIGDRSEQLGVSVARLSELRYAAERTDLSFEQLADGYAKALATIGDAAQGRNKSVVDEFRKLAIEMRQGGQLRPFEEVMDELLDKASTLGAYEQAALLRRMFGKGGSDFIRFVTLGRENLKALRQEAKELGVIFDEDQIAAAGRYEDALKRLKASWEGLKAQVVEAAAPMAAALANVGASLVSNIPTMVNNLKQFVGDWIEGTLSEEQKGKFQVFLASIGTLVREAVIDYGVLVGLTLTRVLPGILTLARPAFDVLWYKLLDEPVVEGLRGVKDYFIDAVRGLNSGVAALFPSNTGLQIFTAGVAAELNALDTAFDLTFNAQRLADVAKAKRELETLDFTARALGKTIRDQVVPATERFYGNIGSNIGSVLGALGDLVGYKPISAPDLEPTADAVQEISNGLAGIASLNLETVLTNASLQMDAVDTSLHSMVGELQDFRIELPMIRSEASQAIAGFWQGVSDAGDQAFNTFERVREITYGVADSISTGLSGAFVDVISGVKGMKDAFRDFAASTLREISAVIMRLLIMRAITGIAESFATPLTPMNSPNLVAGPPVPGLASGGWASGSAPRYGSGYLHALHPPEFVVSERGTRANSGSVLDYMNRGGRVAPVGSGGGSVNVSISYHFSGGVSDMNDAMLRQIEDRTIAAVEKGLATRPGFRAAVRGA